ncbi:unnamed protein product [Durusdinium trenchii]|uniref:Uncharacterized protein n=1 Tax=Durusdinium trenchii TaxID=1381693 RepID=A0ABP0J604_9DINO
MRSHKKIDRRNERRERKEIMLNTFLRSHRFGRDVNEPRSSRALCLPFGKPKEVFYPLHQAAKLGDCEIVRLLLAAGADPQQKTSQGRTAEEIALEEDSLGSHEEVLMLLTSQIKVLPLREAVKMMQVMHQDHEGFMVLYGPATAPEMCWILFSYVQLDKLYRAPQRHSEGQRANPGAMEPTENFQLRRQLELLDEVKTRGFEGKLDFLYLPWSKKEGKNEGYCILSFVDGRDAQDFFLEFYGNFLTSAPASSKSLSVCEVPNIQGLKALHGEFGHLSNQDPEYDPLFLRQVAAKPRTHLPQADFEAHGESACIHCRTRLHRGQTHCPRCGASVKVPKDCVSRLNMFEWS